MPKKNYLRFSLDFVESDDSLIQRSNKKNLASISPDIEKDNTPMIYRTKYPTFLPTDFTVDELEGLTEQSTNLFTDDFINYVKTIGKKLAANQSTTSVALNDDEVKLIR